MLAQSRLQTLVCVTRMSEAEQFYGQTLGLPLKGLSHGARIYEFRGAELRVSPVPSLRPSEHTVLGFAVTDFAAIHAGLSARGVQWVTFVGLAQDSRGILTTPEGAQVAWFRDPDGNLLSIVQYA
jgi:catechol 2,3-dioxygenase-like lactoylglutathione lyase family enzyme